MANKATKAQIKAGYWENEHSVVFEELVKSRRNRGSGKGKLRPKRYNANKY